VGLQADMLAPHRTHWDKYGKAYIIGGCTAGAVGIVWGIAEIVKHVRGDDNSVTYGDNNSGNQGGGDGDRTTNPPPEETVEE